MNIARNYIRRAQSQVRGGRNPWHNFVDDAKHFGFVQQPAFMNADGGAASAPASQAQGVKPSMPYSITITNASGGAIQNFSVLGATNALNNPNFTFDAFGSLIVGPVTISSNTPGVTYRDLLYQSLTQAFTVGETYLACSAPTAQVLIPFTIATFDANGTQVNIPVKPKKDPYQNQIDVLVDTTVYRIDGLTKLTFSQILANAVLNVDFYPQDNVNAGRLLNGAQPTRSYGNPGTIRSSVAVIPAAGAAQSNFSGPMMIKTRL